MNTVQELVIAILSEGLPVTPSNLSIFQDTDLDEPEMAITEGEIDEDLVAEPTFWQ